MRKQKLNDQQLTIWNKLRNLKDGERMIGRDLMAATGISEERVFYSVIENLRLAGYQVGASKDLYNPGYYQKRTDKDAWDYHFNNVEALEKEIDRITINTSHFFYDKYGKDFDFLKHKAEEEELKRDENKGII